MTDDHEMRVDCAVTFEGIAKTNDAIQGELAGLREDVNAQTKAAEDNHAQLIRTLHGYDDKPGFGGRINSLEQSRAWHRRLLWAAIPAIFALTGGGILLLLRILWT